MAIPNSFDILQAVIEATPDAIFVKDLEGRYVVVNAAAARFLGRPPEDIIGKHDLELYPESTARRFMADDQQVLSSGRALTFEGIARSDTGVQAYLVTKGVYRDGHGNIQGIFGISHDVTELRQANEALERAREALYRSQRLEAIGHLTSGLAHDFNNILSVILGNLELLRIQLGAHQQTPEVIDTIIRAAAHAQELTGNLLAFGRKRRLNIGPVDIHARIEHMVRLLARTLPARVSITADLDAAARTAMVDATAFEAALLNVIMNARDAMPEGGSVTIRTYRTEITTPPEADGDPPRGTYAVVSITDTGIGMSDDVSARVFEPLFTTKAEEGGTGLGLSMVHDFARECGGAVTISSRPGAGTEVRLFLPLATETVGPGGG